MIFKRLSQWFWNADFWLPKDMKWEDFVNKSSSNDLFYTIPMAMVIIILRYTIENKIFRPLGCSLGIKPSRHSHLGTNDILEEAYKSKISGKKKVLSQGDIIHLSKQLNMTERKIERWLRKRTMKGKSSQLDKFAETGWRWTYCTTIFLWGIKCLWGKHWLWRTKDCWHYPQYQHMDSDIWWWYMVDMSYYLGLLTTQFFDVKRKDFWMMFIHHIASIILLSFSWLFNLYKVGTLVLIIHEVSELFLETAKLFKYCGAKKLSETFFFTFGVSWFVTRLGIYPIWVLCSSFMEAPKWMGFNGGYFFFNAMLSVIFLLNIGWSLIICKVVYNSLTTNVSISNDIRSDTSDNSEENNEEMANEFDNKMADGFIDRIGEGFNNNNALKRIQGCHH